MTAPTILIVLPTAHCTWCGAPVCDGQAFCSGECEVIHEAAQDEWARQEDERMTQCVVCGSWSECGTTCSKGCYDLWIAADYDDDDHRNYSPFFRSF